MITRTFRTMGGSGRVERLSLLAMNKNMSVFCLISYGVFGFVRLFLGFLSFCKNYIHSGLLVGAFLELGFTFDCNNFDAITWGLIWLLPHLIKYMLSHRNIIPR